LYWLKEATQTFKSGSPYDFSAEEIIIGMKGKASAKTASMIFLLLILILILILKYNSIFNIIII
jgi:hypothetical protein